MLAYSYPLLSIIWTSHHLLLRCVGLLRSHLGVRRQLPAPRPPRGQSPLGPNHHPAAASRHLIYLISRPADVE